MAQRHPRAGLGPGPWDPFGHGQLPSSSPRRAARPRQRCQPGSTSSINSLHTVHIDRLCSLPGAPPPLSPPPRRLLHRWAAQPACCMIHTNSLTQGNQWARKSTRSKARSLSGDRPPSKETQRAAARAPAPRQAARGPGGPADTRHKPHQPVTRGQPARASLPGRGASPRAGAGEGPAGIAASSPRLQEEAQPPVMLQPAQAPTSSLWFSSASIKFTLQPCLSFPVFTQQGQSQSPGII